MNFVKFINLTDLIQVFINEYCKPGNKILIISEQLNELKNKFEFINCETYFVTKNSSNKNCDFVVKDFKNLPFEEKSFDIIIDLIDFKEINLDYLKPGGILLTNTQILNGNEYYHLNDEIFTLMVET